GALLAGLLVTAAASAQVWAGRGRLTGTVQDTDGTPVEGASVKLTLNDAGPDEVMTNAKGRWARAGLAGGTWDVLVSKAGYVPTTHTTQVQEYASPSDRVFLKTTLELGQASATDGSAAALADDEAAQAARDLLERGNSLLLAGDYEGAIGVFSEALTSVPDGAKTAVLVAIAQAQVQLERDDEALASLEQALSLTPTNVDALRLMSRRLTALGRGEEAQAYLERMPEDQRADPEILVREGVELYNQNDFEGALAKLNAAVEAESDWADAYYFRGLANMAAGQNAAAAADFRRLLELEPEGERAEEAKQFAEYLESL
ncbi:MAG: carboxypeptidase regulatory-like domain-containing protein, partial [Acidobacteria bacterium]|nr:carboxypeptidase regulatory-like domain-containing protein [Acidobacteriota bacterium]